MLRNIAVLLLLAGCAVPEQSGDTSRQNSTEKTEADYTAMKTFSGPVKTQLNRSNSETARDFLDLTFSLETGRELPVMTRFDTPITVRLNGATPPAGRQELSRLIKRLRTEAQIDIRQVDASAPAAVSIETLPRKDLQRHLPDAACFVVPRVSSWEEYRRNRRSNITDWATLETRTKAAIFIPSDVSPQEFRDCLHEELAQAIGPLNDLYRLSDSVFNDDNFHTILTGFDMLVLRAYYSPELASGMTRGDVEARLPALLKRINPAGGSVTPLTAQTTPDSWKKAIETAMSANRPRQNRLAGASKALQIAQNNGWTDSRRAFSLYAYGRMIIASDAEEALQAFVSSQLMYKNLGNAEIQQAHVGMQLAAFALTDGNPDFALSIVNSYLPAVRAEENAALLATLLLLKAEALDAIGRASEARATRLDSYGWARYGFGDDAVIKRRQKEIAQLNRPPRI
ncbi:MULTISPECIES: DUF2927 domain-containing protein [Halocynthiibacter]|uniref:DUF2927 domain-containing protein n=1 Tax=Halocynthiibacter halioticoli TaxID=2986804 RepID=A0AAE3LSZ4_9RHOB|nr:MULTISPECIES: DUF2927 domain-containing protein [Halocynthiibacter]MCV6824216.1 DUF2927 domain-containing protein [Halocynthiibacter halioticoli]MCW4057217.1 DUF2927 domain-containing protein [Halocynthiibacter sp. SDUM655004]